MFWRRGALFKTHERYMDKNVSAFDGIPVFFNFFQSSNCTSSVDYFCENLFTLKSSIFFIWLNSEITVLHEFSAFYISFNEILVLLKPTFAHKNNTAFTMLFKAFVFLKTFHSHSWRYLGVSLQLKLQVMQLFQSSTPSQVFLKKSNHSLNGFFFWILIVWNYIIFAISVTVISKNKFFRNFLCWHNFL